MFFHRQAFIIIIKTVYNGNRFSPNHQNRVPQPAPHPVYGMRGFAGNKALTAFKC